MDVTEVVETFVDGEAVAPADLMAALSEPEGRQLLVDLLVLRGLVLGHDTPRPVAAVAAPRSNRWKLLSVAAGLAAVCITSGYVAGMRSAPRAGIAQVAPSASTAFTGASTDVAPVSAPAPTRVIRLSTGVDWTERAGGN